MTAHLMAKILQHMADHITEVAPEDVARRLRDGAECIDSLFALKNALAEQLAALSGHVAQQASQERGGVALIAAERARQISVEGWTPEHDDEHRHGQLAAAAACYSAPTICENETETTMPRKAILAHWPWALTWWKPSPNDRVRELVKAGALIAAEIDRLQRASPPASAAEDDRPASMYGLGNKAEPAAADECPSRDAWAILRPDGKTLHPESVRGNEHSAQWSIGEWPQLRRDGFRCIPVRIVAAQEAAK